MGQLIRDTATTIQQAGPTGALRSTQAVSCIVGILADTAAGRLGPSPTPQRLLKQYCERMGGAYVKLGQFVASSPSAFPREFVEEFETLLDAAAPLPFSVVEGIVAAELRSLGLSMKEEIEDMSVKPLASASIAQVHSARLRRSGKEVVLKVQRPGIRNTLQADIGFVTLGAKLLELLVPDLQRSNVAAILEDVQRTMREECDFTMEAKNLRVFANYLKNGDIQGAKAPFVYETLSTKRLLVMERLRGAPLTDLDAIRRVTRGRANAEETLVRALNVWLGSVLTAESFHADVHAGNLLVLEDGSIGFIDFGIVGKIPPQTWGAVQAFLAAAAANEPRAMATALASMGATSDAVDVDGLASDLSKVMKGIFSVQRSSEITVTVEGEDAVGAAVQFDEREVNRLLVDIVEMGESHGLRFPREFGLLIKQLLYFDRYTSILAPDLSLNDIASDRIIRESPPPPPYS